VLGPAGAEARSFSKRGEESYALGLMIANNRFPPASCVFVDGDQEEKPRVNVLPGGDAPEIVVFRDLEKKNWAELHAKIHRGFSDAADACKQATTYGNHHDRCGTQRINFC
jgi:hypothetical protein